jgi:hypothetical protein
MPLEILAPVCPYCGKPMQLVRTTPGLGALPELLTFACAHCSDVETVESRPVPANEPDAPAAINRGVEA